MSEQEPERPAPDAEQDESTEKEEEVIFAPDTVEDEDAGAAS